MGMRTRTNRCNRRRLGSLDTREACRTEKRRQYGGVWTNGRTIRNRSCMRNRSTKRRKRRRHRNSSCQPARYLMHSMSHGPCRLHRRRSRLLIQHCGLYQRRLLTSPRSGWNDRIGPSTSASRSLHHQHLARRIRNHHRFPYPTLQASSFPHLRLRRLRPVHQHLLASSSLARRYRQVLHHLSRRPSPSSLFPGEIHRSQYPSRLSLLRRLRRYPSQKRGLPFLRGCWRESSPRRLGAGAVKAEEEEEASRGWACQAPVG